MPRVVGSAWAVAGIGQSKGNYAAREPGCCNVANFRQGDLIRHSPNEPIVGRSAALEMHADLVDRSPHSAALAVDAIVAGKQELKFVRQFLRALDVELRASVGYVGNNTSAQRRVVAGSDPGAIAERAAGMFALLFDHLAKPRR